MFNTLTCSVPIPKISFSLIVNGSKSPTKLKKVTIPVVEIPDTSVNNLNFSVFIPTD